MEKTPITEQEILAARTPKGAWTRKTLAEWGVPWPPPHGWKAMLIERGYFNGELLQQFNLDRDPVEAKVDGVEAYCPHCGARFFL